MSEWPVTRKPNAFEETLAKLLQRISLGQYILGEKLPPERELAHELAVSRATLRSALQELQATGVISISRGRYGGATVIGLPSDHENYQSVDSSDLDDAIQFRALLDRAAARLVAEATLSAEARQLLRTAVEKCTRATVHSYRQFDSRFHLTIAELSGVPSLLQASRQARDRINSLLDRIPMIGTNLTHSNQQHEAIISAILDGDARTAEQLADEHARGTESLLRGYLSEDSTH